MGLAQDNRCEIALDISFLGIPDGIGTYTGELLNAYQRLYPDYPFLLLSNLFPRDMPLYQQQEALIQSRLPLRPRAWRHIQTDRKHRRIWQGYDLPRLLQRNRPALYHALDNLTLPLFRKHCPCLLTVHDLIAITHPEYCRARDAWVARHLIQHALNQADEIITDSHYSAHEIARRFPSKENRIHVVPLGVNHQRFAPGKDREDLAHELAQRYAFHSSRFVLLVSTLNPRKNMEKFLRAFAHFSNRSNDADTCLVIVGSRGWREHSIFAQVESLQLTHRVHFMNFVPDEDLIGLYQSALAYANPSLLEGFGLPILEAMACGAPVLCSATTSLGEIAENAALLFDPQSESSMTSALIKITEQETLRQSLSNSGLARAATYCWDRTAQETMNLYRKWLL